MNVSLLYFLNEQHTLTCPTNTEKSLAGTFLARTGMYYFDKKIIYTVLEVEHLFVRVVSYQTLKQIQPYIK